VILPIFFTVIIIHPYLSVPCKDLFYKFRT